MKKFFLFGITLFFALFLGLSCKNRSSENSIIPEKDNLVNREADNSLDWGDIHNQAMDDLFKNLEEDFHC